MNARTFLAAGASLATAAAISFGLGQCGSASAATVTDSTAITSSARTASPAVAPSLPPATTTADAPICWYGACYDYVVGQQVTNATGAQIVMGIADPEVNQSAAAYGEHTLQELALQNADQTSTVEIGWTVDPSLNGDAHAHLFVYHWVNGQESCYNGCGFVQVSKWIKPGMRIHPGVGQFAIRNVNGNWWVYFDFQPVGYFPGSLWNGTYTKAQLISAFGEVAEMGSDSPSCTDMGNGRFGSKPFASFIAGYRLEGSTDAPNLAVRATSPSQYDFGAVSPTSFRLGGPGTGRCGPPASAAS